MLCKPTYAGLGWLLPFRVEYPDNAGLFYPVNIPVFEGKYGAMMNNTNDALLLMEDSNDEVENPRFNKISSKNLSTTD